MRHSIWLRGDQATTQGGVDANDGRAPEVATALNAVLKLEEKVAEQKRETTQQQEQQQKSLKTQEEQIEAISQGVFRSWNQSPIGWILGGGTALALVDFWVRWWTIGL